MVLVQLYTILCLYYILQHKYIIKDESAWDCIDNEFNQYMQDQNEKYPERKLSNVEILDASFIGYVYLPLE